MTILQGQNFYRISSATDTDFTIVPFDLNGNLLTTIWIQTDTTTAPIDIYLPEINTLGGKYDIRINFVDIALSAGSNNVTINSSGSDVIDSSGNTSVKLANNESSIFLIGVSDAAWSSLESFQAVAPTPVIVQGAGVGSSVRTNASNVASGCYATSLGQNNQASGIYSSTLSGAYNNVSACCSSAFGVGNIVNVTNSDIIGGSFNVIARDAISPTLSGYHYGIVNGVLTLSSVYGDVSAYYPSGSTISSQYTFTNSQINYFNLNVLGSSFDGTATTICFNPTVNTCSGYLIKTGPFLPTSSCIPNIISGGSFNTICGNGVGGSTISGGYLNTASACSSVGGGAFNISTGGNSTVAGGRANSAIGIRTTIAGGGNNTSNSISSTIGGGFVNTASSYYSTVAGGNFNTSSGCKSIIGGGTSNTASGYFSGILGGFTNTASNYKSFIVGSDITSDRDCTTFVNALSMKTAPTSAAGLPAGTIWVDTAAGNVLKMA